MTDIANLELPAGRAPGGATSKPQSLQYQPMKENSAVASGIAAEAAEPADETLALDAGGGDMRSFEELVRRHERRLFAFLVKRVGNHHDAEDLVQQTFVKAHRNIHRFNPKYRFSTWLYTIGCRLAASHYRKRRPMGAEEPHAVDREDPSRVASRNETHSGLWEIARGALNENQFTALWLHYAEEMPVKEVAKVMDKTVTTVKVTLFRARNALGKAMEADEVRAHWNFQETPTVGQPRSTQ